MRFAITGVDRSFSIFEAFLQAGWEPLKVFTAPVDDYHDHHIKLVTRANALKIPIQLSRITDDDLYQLGAAGCEVLVVSNYGWRIGDWARYLPHAINFHPSLLPDARGPYPMVRAILRAEPHWGVTCHKVSAEFDAGDILTQSAFALQDDETLDSLNLKIEIAAGRLAGRVARDFKTLWAQARPQEGGSYWGKFTDAERTLDFNQPVADILRVVRAFGRIECLARLDRHTVYVRRAVGWVEAHAHQPGTVVYEQHRQKVVAVADGYVGLIEWSALQPGGERHIGR